MNLTKNGTTNKGVSRYTITMDDEFWKKALPILKKCVKGLYSGLCEADYEDVTSRAILYLISKKDYYYSTYSLSTWIYLQTQKAVWKHIHDVEKHKSESLDDFLNDPMEEEPVAAYYEEVEFVEDRLMCLAAPFMTTMNTGEYGAFYDKYIKGMTTDAIAKKRMRHKKTILRLIRAAEAKVRAIAQGGRRENPRRKMPNGTTLQVAIMGLEDAPYFAYYFHALKGLSLMQISKLNGFCIHRNKALIKHTQLYLRGMT